MAYHFQIGNKDNALYLHHFPIYIQFLLDNYNGDNGDTFSLPQRPSLLGASLHTNNAGQVSMAQNRIILALIFSSNPSTLRLAHHLIFRFHVELGIRQGHVCYLVHLVESSLSSRIDGRTVDALKHLPQSKLSWSSDLANVMNLVLQLLLIQSWTAPFYFINQHEQSLRRRKPLKHISTGSPHLASRFYDYGSKGGWSRPTTKYDYDLPYDYDFSTARENSAKRLSDRRARIMCDEGYDCILLLKAVIFFLRKADHTREVARLARKSLPKATLWFPKLMKRARAEMDEYVLRWEGE